MDDPNYSQFDDDLNYLALNAAAMLQRTSHQKRELRQKRRKGHE